MNTRSLLLSAAILALWGACGLSSPRAATYTTDVTADPNALSCGYYVTSEICGNYSLLANPVNLIVGDTYNINVAYTSTLSVPGSTTANNAYVIIFDEDAVGGAPIPGPDMSSNSSTIQGYLGPANPYTTYTSAGYLDGYIAAVGFCCGAAPNSGFSLTGMQSSLTILPVADPNPIVGVGWGYSYNLPATPEVLAAFAGGSPGHPAILPSGEIGQISDSIGSGGEDFYQFNWTGGDFQTQATVTDATASDELEFELLNPYTHDVIPGAETLLSAGDGFTGLISVGSLPAGAYEIGIQNQFAADPNFTISFNTPVGSVGSAPEPATWTLMLAGFGALGAALRASQRKRHAAGVPA